MVTLVCAPTLPAASRRWGEGRVLLALELLHAALLLATAFVTQRALAIAAIAGLGLPFAGFLVIPYSIVGRAAAKTSGAGQYMATMNLFLCLPELLVSLAAAPARARRRPGSATSGLAFCPPGGLGGWTWLALGCEARTRATTSVAPPPARDPKSATSRAFTLTFRLGRSCWPREARCARRCSWPVARA